MSAPTVSVIMPAYNQADYIGPAIQSVLDQTFADFELIVIDDGSTDGTAAAVQQFGDPRIRYLFQQNRGLPAARNAAIKASYGRVLALLDSDDLYHPDKLAAQVTFLAEHPEVGLSYNSRFEIGPSGACLALIQAPATVGLTDLVQGFPFAPSDVVMRREWAFRVGLYDETFVFNSEDLDFHIRLALAGCSFAGLTQAFNYRRLYPGRVFSRLIPKLETMLRALDTAFCDPRCPPEVLALREVARAGKYFGWALQELFQAETALGQAHLREAVRLDPSLFAYHGSRFLNALVYAAVRDGGEHEPLVRRVVEQLPAEMGWLGAYSNWAIGRGYLSRGVRSVLWGPSAQATADFGLAAQWGASPDESFLRDVVEQLMRYAAEFGPASGEQRLQDLASNLEKIGARAGARWLKGCYVINRAFHAYQARRYPLVVQRTLQAVSYDPSYLANRGVLSVFARSVAHSSRQAFNSRFRRPAQRDGAEVVS